MKEWRPEGFRNPYTPTGIEDFPTRTMLEIKAQVWEECSSAMLKALREQGQRVDADLAENKAFGVLIATPAHGYVICIPEDKE